MSRKAFGIFNLTVKKLVKCYNVLMLSLALTWPFVPTNPGEGSDTKLSVRGFWADPLFPPG